MVVLWLLLALFLLTFDLRPFCVFFDEYVVGPNYLYILLRWIAFFPGFLGVLLDVGPGR